MKIQHSRQKKQPDPVSWLDARKRNTITQIGIVTMMVILLLMVWPFRVFEHSRVSGYDPGIATSETGAITMEEIVLQPFVPTDSHIADMEIDVNAYEVHGQDRVFVTIYNNVFEIIWQEVVYFTEIEASGYIAVSPQLDVVVGETYYLGMNVHFDSRGTLKAVYGSMDALSVPELAPFVYANNTYSTEAVLMKFHYTAPFSTLLLIGCTVAILAGGVGLYAAVVYVMNRWAVLSAAKKKIIKKAVLILGTLMALIGLVIAFVQLCVVKLFGGMALDHGVYAAACLILLVGVGLFGMNMWKRIGRVDQEEELYECRTAKQHAQKAAARKPQQADTLQTDRGILRYLDVSMWQNYLQTLAYVLLIYAGIMYVNATIQWKQDLNAAWVFLLFGVSIVVSYAAKDLFNVWNLAWGIVMIPTGMVLCHLQDGREHGSQIGAIFMVAVFFWGIVLIRTLRSWNRKKLHKLCLPIGIVWVLLCIGMLLTGHEKQWVLWMIPAFTLFYLQYDPPKDCERVVRNFGNGVLANFVLILILCLLHRPYEYYQFNRYPMWFHTVASTGMYLALVEAVALVRLYVRMRETGSVWKGCVKEWLLHTIVIAYISFTVARTALMSVGGIMIVLVIGTAIVYRPRIKRYVQILGMLVLLFVLSIPVCYTATRCIPAVVNEPQFVAEDIENFTDAVRKGDAPDSNKYMNFKALMRLWGARLGLPEFLTRPFADDVPMGQAYLNIEVRGELASSVQDGTDMVGVLEDEWLVAAVETETLGGMSAEEPTSKADDLSNGRISIFKTYLKELNWTGHDSMVYVCEDGSMIAHSHNTFIQAAYDFGILTGILFLFLCLLTIFRAVVAIWNGYNRSEAMFLSLLLSCAYLITSISEYVGNPNMPLCFAYLFLLITMRMGKNVIK